MNESEIKRVRCVCNGVKVVATYEVEGGYLVLNAPFGTTRTLLGIQQPRRVAAKLLKNLCAKAPEGTPTTCCGLLPLPAMPAPDVSPTPPLPAAIAKKP